MKLLEDLKWRYAAKKFDPTKKVSEQDLQAILEAGNLAATSFGLQAYRFVVVQNKEVIAELAKCSWGEQLHGASHVIVLAACTKVDEEFVEDYIKLNGVQRQTEEAKLAKLGEIIVGHLNNLEKQNSKDDWAARQTYIVLGTLLAACAAVRVDSCPMEGIQKDKYDEILGLAEKNLTTISALPIGYRAADDHHQDANKVRRSLDEMVLTI